MDTPPSAAQIKNDVSNEARGLFSSLLDFSFESFVTPKIIKVAYFLMLLGVILFALVFLGTNLLSFKFTTMLFGLIVTPIILILGAIGARVYVEIVMLAFKILDTLQRIEAQQKITTQPQKP